MTREDSSPSERVRQIVARTFRCPPEEVTAETGIGVLRGWDSLGHLTLMMEIEKEFSVRFSTKQIGRPKTVTEICQLLEVVQSNE
jgi:acyl carrier protein